MYDYRTFCVKNKLKYSGQSIKMWTDYCEVSEASTDMKDDMNYATSATVSNWISFAPIPQQACTVPCDMAECKPAQKKEKTMYVDNDKHIESSKINYLTQRARDIFYKQDGKLREQFGLTVEAAPATAADLIKRIQDGKFSLKEDLKDRRTYNPTDFIVWRDPAVKEDKDGYKVAEAALQVVLQDTQDTIAIGTPAEGLAAVKALDAWAPTAK